MTIDQSVGDLPDALRTAEFVEQPTISRQLFAPDSRLNRMRARVAVADKMRGYFHWRSMEKRRSLPSARIAADPNLPTDTDWPHGVWHIGQSNAVAASDLEITIVPAGEGGERMLQSRFSLAIAADRPAASVPCRALWIDPEILMRLLNVVGGTDHGRSIGAVEQRNLDATTFRALIPQILQEKCLNEVEMTRALTALPEMEGHIDTNGICEFTPLPLPAGNPPVLLEDLTRRFFTVIVIDIGHPNPSPVDLENALRDGTHLAVRTTVDPSTT